MMTIRQTLRQVPLFLTTVSITFVLCTYIAIRNEYVSSIHLEYFIVILLVGPILLSNIYNEGNIFTSAMICRIIGYIPRYQMSKLSVFTSILFVWLQERLSTMVSQVGRQRVPIHYNGLFKALVRI